MTDQSATIRGEINSELEPTDRMTAMMHLLPEGVVYGLILSSELWYDLLATNDAGHQLRAEQEAPTTFASLHFIVDHSLAPCRFEIIRSEEVWRESKIRCAARLGAGTKPGIPEDGDMRMLGAVDGYAHALVDVRMQIALITHFPIDAKHTRKIAARQALLRPLQELEKKFAAQHATCRAAYQKTREPKPVPDSRHYYMAHKKFPWICSHCGYSEREPLKHFQKGETINSSVSA